MSLKILYLNGGKSFGHSHGALNDSLTEIARETLAANGHDVRVTRIDDGYDTKEQVEQIVWADVVIYQMPGWWMGTPWTVKKYMDEVFTEGYGTLYASDGRTRTDPTRNYGTGGLLQGKRYMLSLTWNAPAEAFSDPDQFFEGRGVDGVYLPVHKANQFLGMAPLPTYIAHDVMKALDFDATAHAFRAHLNAVFPAA